MRATLDEKQVHGRTIIQVAFPKVTQNNNTDGFPSLCAHHMPDSGSNTELKVCSRVWVYRRDITPFSIIDYYNSRDEAFSIK